MKFWETFDEMWPWLATVLIVLAAFWLGLLIGSTTARADALAQVTKAVEMAEQAQDIAADALQAQTALTERAERAEALLEEAMKR